MVKVIIPQKEFIVCCLYSEFCAVICMLQDGELNYTKGRDIILNYVFLRAITYYGSVFVFSFKKILIYAYGCFAHMYVNEPHVCSVHGGMKKTLGPRTRIADICLLSGGC